MYLKCNEPFPCTGTSCKTSMQCIEVSAWKFFMWTQTKTNRRKYTHKNRETWIKQVLQMLCPDSSLTNIGSSLSQAHYQTWLHQAQGPRQSGLSARVALLACMDHVVGLSSLVAQHSLYNSRSCPYNEWASSSCSGST